MQDNKKKKSFVSSVFLTVPKIQLNKGLIVPKSSCCNAVITYSKGGFRLRVCSACGQPVQRTVFK